MHKFWNWVLSIIAILLLFSAGFYIGMLDNTDASKITVTSRCTGIGVSKTFSSNYEQVDGRVVRDEKTNTETYSTRCLCFASDRTHENIWVDTVQLMGKTADEVRELCNTDCQKCVKADWQTLHLTIITNEIDA